MNQSLFVKYIAGAKNAKIQGRLAVYEIPLQELRKYISYLHQNRKLPLKTITATDERESEDCFKVFYVFGVPKERIFIAPYVRLKDGEGFPSLVETIPAASSYERSIFTFFGLQPLGHPALQPLNLHENWPKNQHPLRKEFSYDTVFPYQKSLSQNQGMSYSFQKVEGEGIYELPVGPVHAGIIEPGHFRFSLAGEEVIVLEARLGYTHKGIEKLFEQLPLAKKVSLAERVSGDSSFNHSLAFCQAVEVLARREVPERARFIRTFLAEMERLANHFNDIGFIMMDTAYTFGGAQGARLREMIMGWNEQLTGSRFLRGINDIGGLRRDISDDLLLQMRNNLLQLRQDFQEVMNIAKNSSIMVDRLRRAGVLSAKVARDQGAVGIAARACGQTLDARHDFPYAAYEEVSVPVVSEDSSDVYARFMVRVREVFSSLEIIDRILSRLPSGPVLAGHGGEALTLLPDSYSVGISEGWRGDIIYFVATDRQGNISRVHPRDPSFLNWGAVSSAVAGNVVPDFPLINKSFNLSYSGHDL